MKSSYMMLSAVLLLVLCQAAQAEDWLVSRDGLVYGYALGTGAPKQERVVAFDDKGESTEAGKDMSFVANRGRGLVPRGLARYDHYFGLATFKGSFRATGGVNHIVTSIKESGAITVEALLTPPRELPAKPAVILWLGPASGDPNFALVQDGQALSLRLRLAQDRKAEEHVIPLLDWPDDKPHHLAVTFTGTQLAVYLDGKQVKSDDQVKGELSRWRASELIFGDDVQQTASWSGKIEAVGIYDRALGAEEIKAQHELTQRMVGQRKPIESLRVVGTLKARSAIPEPDRIQPYYQALTVFQYEVKRVIQGKYDGKDIAVAHWAILDSKKQPIEQRQIGAEVEMVVEPYTLNPQLETDYWLMSDVDDPDAPLWYDVTEIP